MNAGGGRFDVGGWGGRLTCGVGTVVYAVGELLLGLMGFFC